MEAVLNVLRQFMPYLLPVLIVIGQRLKAASWFSNKLIPITLVVLNVGRLWLMKLGLATPGAGEGAPLEPAMVIGAPVLALAGMIGATSAVMSVLTFGAQLAVDHWLVNKAHKGLKYRALYKAAEKAGLVDAGSSTSLKASVRW